MYVLIFGLIGVAIYIWHESGATVDSIVSKLKPNPDTAWGDVSNPLTGFASYDAQNSWEVLSDAQAAQDSDGPVGFQAFDWITGWSDNAKAAAANGTLPQFDGDAVTNWALNNRVF